MLPRDINLEEKLMVDVDRNYVISDSLRTYIFNQKIQSGCASCWAGLFGTSKISRMDAAQALIDHINFEDANTLANVAVHLKTLEHRDLKSLWMAYGKENSQQYYAIKAEALKIEAKKREASYDHSGGYDSDTSERIQGRCSKD